MSATVTVSILDVCLPDCFQGYSRSDDVEVLCAPVDGSTTGDELRTAILESFGDLHDFHMEIDDDTARDAIAACVPDGDVPLFSALDPRTDDDDTESVYAYFVIEVKA